MIDIKSQKVFTHTSDHSTRIKNQLECISFRKKLECEYIKIQNQRSGSIPVIKQRDYFGLHSSFWEDMKFPLFLSIENFISTATTTTLFTKPRWTDKLKGGGSRFSKRRKAPATTTFELFFSIDAAFHTGKLSMRRVNVNMKRYVVTSPSKRRAFLSSDPSNRSG